ncbi:hypothetical protein CCR95_01320 [Thiocystis minor]|nr:hypothetical protein [Thiocystis minor]
MRFDSVVDLDERPTPLLCLFSFQPTIESVVDRLLSWGVYLETPDLSFSGIPIIGVYASLEHDLRDGYAELRLLLDSEHPDLHLLPVPLRLGHGSLLASANATHDVAWNRAVTDFPDKVACFENIDPAQDARDLAPILALLLYLCADEADDQRPSRPRLVKTRAQGRLMIVPDQVSYWEVGERLGAAMRLARADAPGEAGAPATQTRPRPHWRRAHWHTFWTGRVTASAPHMCDGCLRFQSVSTVRIDQLWCIRSPLKLRVGEAPDRSLIDRIKIEPSQSLPGR